MIDIPETEQEQIPFFNELIQQCRVSVGARSGYYKILNAIAETGTSVGNKALINYLNKILEKAAAHLFSPIELKFAVDFENTHPPNIYKQGNVVAKLLTRQWDRNNTDMLFGLGVFTSLKYGATLMKQWAQNEGEGRPATYHAKLVMPWQFGVYNESENDLNNQPVLCETSPMTLPEVWRRIWHQPNAKQLMERIRAHSLKGTAPSVPQSFFHQILSTSTLQTGVQGATQPLPGGIVQLNNDPNYAIMGPQVAAEMVDVHELWIQGIDDYVTVQMVEPDILITKYKLENLLIRGSRTNPYTLIQPNEVANWFWGRSELVDLMETQSLIATTLDDYKRVIGLQIDKILAFIGEDTITDEKYGDMRVAGYTNLGPGASVEDLTPKMPEEIVPYLEFLISQLKEQAGFPPIMQGVGEQGVRAGSHANTLVKTASPRMRDQALTVERQCAMAADKTLQIREAKDPARYWVDGKTPEDADKSSFLLASLPDDWRVTVDSHSSSPIFSDENTQLVFASHQRGIVDGEYVIDNTNLPNKEQAKESLKQKEQKQQQLMAQLAKNDPEGFAKVLERQLGGGGSHHR